MHLFFRHECSIAKFGTYWATNAMSRPSDVVKTTLRHRSHRRCQLSSNRWRLQSLTCITASVASERLPARSRRGSRGSVSVRPLVRLSFADLYTDHWSPSTSRPASPSPTHPPTHAHRWFICHSPLLTTLIKKPTHGVRSPLMWKGKMMRRSDYESGGQANRTRFIVVYMAGRG